MVTRDAEETAYRYLKSDARQRRSAAEHAKMKGNPTNRDIVDFYSGPCCICGRTPSVGIDRVDSDKPYSIQANKRSACHPCNVGMKSVTMQVYVSHAKRVARHSLKTIGTQAFTPRRICVHDQPFVAVHPRDNTITGIFFTPSNISRRLGVSKKSFRAEVDSAVSHNRRAYGVYWRRAVESDFRASSRLDGSQVWEIILRHSRLVCNDDEQEEYRDDGEEEEGE